MDHNARCIAHLQAGGIVLTRDLRQARLLRRLHDRARIVAGEAVWPSAQVLPLDDWLAVQWQEASATASSLPELLLPVQAQWLWRRAVAGADRGLLATADLAAAARTSWLRLRSQGGSAADLGRWPLTRDQRQFRDWALQVEQELDARGAADAGDLARLCALHPALPASGPPLLLAGWRQLTPAAQALCEQLRAAGREAGMLGAGGASGDCRTYGAPDPETELDAMLDWLREAALAAPAGLHAAIVPALAERRQAVERACAAVLQPTLEMPGAAAEERVFDLAAGAPLEAWPVVATALAAIDCAGGRGAFAAWSGLLRSPLLVEAATEAAARLRLERQLREIVPVPVAPAAVAALARQHGAAAFASAVDAAVAALAGPAQRRAGDWALAFGRCLAALGWPAAGGLASDEFQAAEAFGERLRQLAQQERVTAPFSWAEARAELGRLARTPFQPERGEPGILILDSLELPGLQLDSLWVSGLTAAAWPRPAAADPFLPLDLQRQLGMPGATPESALAEAREITAGWVAASTRLVLSWPRRENDTDVEASALLPKDAAPLAQRPPAPRRERAWLAAVTLETPADDEAPALAPEAARGGARLLQLQAACPFRAFAELRLGAEELPEPAVGVDRRLRGIVLHRALERFWQETADQAALLALSPLQRGERVAACVDAALERELGPAAGTRAGRLEREWQLLAIGGLLELECERPPFSVLETERQLRGELGGLPFSLRVDRVDGVGDSRIVIDYKTGRSELAHWRGARPEAPQLPLYAVLHPEPLAGIAVAQATAQGAGFLGVGERDGLLPGMTEPGDFTLDEEGHKAESWGQITRRWHATLTRLAERHAAGDATVDPKTPDTCRYCHLGALCRVGGPDAAEDDGG